MNKQLKENRLYNIIDNGYGLKAPNAMISKEAT